jgi:hypothetical protein
MWASWRLATPWRAPGPIADARNRRLGVDSCPKDIVGVADHRVRNTGGPMGRRRAPAFVVFRALTTCTPAEASRRDGRYAGVHCARCWHADERQRAPNSKLNIGIFSRLPHARAPPLGALREFWTWVRSSSMKSINYYALTGIADTAPS